MHRDMPNFEWALEIRIHDEIEDKPEQVSTIADYEPVEPPPIEDDVDIEENEDTINEDAINEDALEIQEEAVEPDIEDGLINVPEDNIVSEEEDFVESEDDDLSDEEMSDNT